VASHFEQLLLNNTKPATQEVQDVSDEQVKQGLLQSEHTLIPNDPSK
jgi:hypothetical protein